MRKGLSLKNLRKTGPNSHFLRFIAAVETQSLRGNVFVIGDSRTLYLETPGILSPMKPRKPQERPRGLIPIPGPTQGGRSIQAPAATLLDTYFRNKDPKTVRVYKRCLGDFQEWLGASSMEEAAARFLGDGQGKANMTALNFKDHLRKQEYAPSSVNTHLVALRSLVKIGRLLGMIPWMLDVENVQNETYRDTAGPGRALFGKVWTELAARTDEMGVRDRTILALAHDAGLRREEIESIDLDHIDWTNDKVWVKAKKKTSRVAVPLNKSVQEEVRKWMLHRGKEPGALFKNFDPAGKGDRLTGTSIDRICKKYGLGHAHGVRHLAITEALEVTNGNIREVMKFSRHSDPKTVMIYDDNRKNVSGAISEKLAELRTGVKKAT